MTLAPNPSGQADQVIAAIRLWLENGGAETMRRELEAARAAADAMVQDMDVPPQAMDLPVTY